MITLDNFEDFVPYKIWMRGEEYYETDAVSELEEISPGEWTATVEGTDDYNEMCIRDRYMIMMLPRWWEMVSSLP